NPPRNSIIAVLYLCRKPLEISVSKSLTPTEEHGAMRAGRNQMVFKREAQFPDASSDRHRGGGHPPTPATPPCVRVRTRRFELVALTPIDQCRKSKRFEVGVGKPHREGFGPSEVPRAASATSRVTSQSRTNPQFQQCRSATARCFPLPPQSCTQSQPDPTGQVNQP